MERMPHICLTCDRVAQFAILPGAPERVDAIAKHMTQVEALEWNREFKSVIGTYQGIRILVVSTGIGGPSTAIVVEELAKLGVKCMIRIGSCGALEPSLRVGDLVLVQGAVREDGTSKSYIEACYPAIPDYDVLQATVESAREIGIRHTVGVIRSHDMIYNDEKERVYAYWGKRGVVASDMESATLFVVGKLRGIQTASILNVVAEYRSSTEDGINAYVDCNEQAMQGEENEIEIAFRACLCMEHRKLVETETIKMERGNIE